MKKTENLSSENKNTERFSRAQGAISEEKQHDVSSADNERYNVQKNISGAKKCNVLGTKKAQYDVLSTNNEEHGVQKNVSDLKNAKYTAGGTTNSDIENDAQAKFTLPTGGTVSANNTVTPSDDDAALINVGLSEDNPTVSEVVGGGHTIPTEKTEGDQFSQFATEYGQSHFTENFSKNGFQKTEPKENTELSAKITLKENDTFFPKTEATISTELSANSEKKKITENFAEKNRVRELKNATTDVFGCVRQPKEPSNQPTPRQPEMRVTQTKYQPTEKTEAHPEPSPTLQSVISDKVYGNTDFFRGKTCGGFEALNASNDKKSTESKDGTDDGKNGDASDGRKDRAISVKAGEKIIKTIVIAGQIEGHTRLPQEQKSSAYEELIPQLVEIEENDEISGLLLILNTVGGDVEAGLALSELIAGMKKPTASLVLGGGHSIGVPLAVAAKRSFIAPSATMTLHPVRVTGMVLSAPQTYVYLNNMQERIINFTCSHCSISKKRFYELMLAREEMSTDLGSVLDGKKAVEEGLIDALGTLADAMEFLRRTSVRRRKMAQNKSIHFQRH